MSTPIGPKDAKRFIELLIKHMEEGQHKIAIVSYSLYPEVIHGIVKMMFMNHAPDKMALFDQIAIVCGFPEDMDKDGKEKHLQAAAEYFKQECGIDFPADQIALMDDSTNNIAIAKANQHPVILAPAQPGLPAQYTRMDFGNTAAAAATKVESNNNNNNNLTGTTLAGYGNSLGKRDTDADSKEEKDPKKLKTFTMSLSNNNASK
ncbi:MAG TPA: hypothetical protein VI522_08070 [Gammaproteobacteria bacterium]|nr:hypothetical protein [Gammaproteobacteria bacterium]